MLRQLHFISAAVEHEEMRCRRKRPPAGAPTRIPPGIAAAPAQLSPLASYRSSQFVPGARGSQTGASAVRVRGLQRDHL
jgi:hypothetical protein